MPKLIGNDNTNTATTVTAGYVIFGRFTADADGSMTEFRHYARGAGTMKFAIYSDNAGVPGSLLNQTGNVVCSAGANVIPFPATNIVSGTDYWLAMNSGINYTIGAANSGGIARYVLRDISLAFPDPAPSTSSVGWLLNYAGYAEDAAGNPMYAYEQQ